MTFDDVKREIRESTIARIDFWLENVFLSWRWWLLVALLTLPWLIWWKVVNRKRLPEMTLVALFTLIIAVVLDEIGTELVIWAYRYRDIPFFTLFIPYDFTVLPVIYSLMYQKFDTWKSYTVAFTILSAFFCFVSEPALAKLGIYDPVRWEYYYGFPIYIAIALLIRWIVRKILREQKAAAAK